MANNVIDVKIYLAWWFLPFQRIVFLLLPFLPLRKRTLIKIANATASFAVKHGARCKDI